MDVIISGIGAIILAIIFILIAIFTKKKIRIIILYGIIGLIIGLVVGYLIAPMIISFF